MSEYLFKMFGLNGQTVALYGGTGGIGPGIGEALARAGASVIPTSRTEERAKEAVRKLDDVGHCPGFVLVDGMEAASVEHAVADLRKILNGRPLDILVVNAGGNKKEAVVGRDQLFLNSPDDVGAEVVALNYTAPRRIIRACLPLMTDSEHPCIVILGSQAPLGLSRVLDYRASKAAVAQLMEFLAQDLPVKCGTKWRVNGVAPGFVLGEQNQGLLKDEVRYNAIIDHTPSGRLQTPEEVGNAVVFLCSPAASGINGHMLTVDGGFEICKLGVKAI